MGNAEQFDVSTLSWVKAEIDETLKQARMALEGFVDEPDDNSQLGFCVSYLHQVHGTLQMVELTGAARFAEEVEALAVAVRDGSVQPEESTLELLMRAILQLPDYLETLLSSGRDDLLPLLPLINLLRTARGEKAESSAEWFNPDLSVAAPLPKVQVEPKVVTALARKVRPYYQAGLLNLLRGQDIAKGIKALATVLDKLVQAVPNDVLRQLFWAGAGYLEAVNDRGVKLENTGKQLLGKLDQVIKILTDAEATMPPVEVLQKLTRALLYQVYQSSSSGTQVQALRDAFGFGALETGAMGGFNAELKQTVARDVLEELSQIKDILDIFVRAEQRAASELEPLSQSMKRVAETLALLEQTELSTMLQQQAESMADMAAHGEAPSDQVLMHIAEAVLAVEATLQDWGRHAPLEQADDRSGQVAASETTAQAEAEHQRVIRQVMKEAKEDIIRLREGVNLYVERPDDKGPLQALPDMVHRLSGSLMMLSYKRSADVMRACGRFVDEQLLQGEGVPEERLMDAFADAVMSIEYYLEAFVEGRVHPTSVLQVAEAAVATLGYPVTDLDVTVATNDVTAELEAVPGDFVAEAVDIVAEADEEEIVDKLSEEPESVEHEALTLDETIAETAEEVPVPALEEVTLTTAVEDQEAAVGVAAVPDVEVVSEEAQHDVEDTEAEANVASATTRPTSTATVEVDDEILEIFIEEAEEELANIQRLLPQWQNDPADHETLKEMRRSFHTLKGSGRLVGAAIVGEFAWAFENMLNRVLDDTVGSSAAMFDVLDQAVEALPELIEEFRSGVQPKADYLLLQEMADAMSKPGGVTLESLPDASTTETEELQPEQEVSIEPEAAEEPALSMDPVLLEIYTSEALTHLTVLAEFIKGCREGVSCRVNEPLIRALHTLAGSSRMADVGAVASLSVLLEKYAKLLQANNRSVEPEGLDILADTVRFIGNYVVYLKAPAGNAEPDSASLLTRVEALYEAAAHLTDEVSPEHGLAIASEPAAEEEEDQQSEPAENKPVFVLDEEASLEETAVVDEIAPLEAEIELVEEEGLPDEVAADEISTVEEPVKVPEVEPELEAFSTGDSSTATLDYDDELLDIFLEEGAEILDASEETLQRWADAPEDSSPVAELQRQLHTLKGSARMAGVSPVGDLSHSLETTFEALVEGRMSRSPDMFNLLQLAHDRLVTMLDDVRTRQPISSGDELIAKIDALGRGGSPVEDATVSQAPDYTALGLDEEQLVAPEFEQPAVDEASAERTEAADEDIVAQPVEPAPVASKVVETAQIEYDDDLVDIFLEEGAEILDASEATLQEWVDKPDERGLVTELQRQLHTLKGGARMSGITPVGDLSHSLESTFEALVEGRAERSPQLLSLLQLAHDRLVTMLEQVGNREPVITGDDLVAQIDALARGEQIEIAESVQQEPVPEVGEAEAEEEDRRDDLSGLDIAPLPASDEGVSYAYTTSVNGINKALESWRNDVTDANLLEGVITAFRYALAVWPDEHPITLLSASCVDLLTAVRDGRAAVSDGVTSLIAMASLRMASAIERFPATETVDTADLMHGIEILLHPEQAESEEIDSKSVVELDSGWEEAPAEVSEGPAEDESSASKADNLRVVPKAGETEDTVRVEAEPSGDNRRQSGRIQHEMVRVRSDLLDNLVNYAGEVSIYRSRVEQQIGSFRTQIDELDQTVSRLRDQVRQFDIETEAQIDSRTREAQEHHEEFDPLEFDRFTNMQQLSRSMMESLADLLSIEEAISNLTRESETLLLQQSRVNTELQESLMHTRMVPLVENAPRLRRIVRQTSAELGKRAAVRFQGAEVEMDRHVVERMLPPLEHMLRNAIAHGLETPEERLKARKLEEGTITVSLARESSEIVIRVSDDGRGIDLEAIRRKATERGLMKPGVKYSDKEVMLFILESGFSTAQELTQVAGRGVGMDVVASEIKQLGGTLELASDPGKGTLFTVRLPLTLSVSRALLVLVAEETYAVPLLSVQGIERVDAGDLLQRLSSDNPTYQWLGSEYQLLHLTRVLGAGAGNLVEGMGKQPVLMAQTGEHRVGIVVDGLIGSREIVVKSLGPQLSALPDLAGATILADGSVALIVDLPSLIRHGVSRHAAAGELEGAVEAQTREPVVMVVDDSITVRKVTERLLKRNNMKSVTAKDGVDALAVLEEVMPDVMLLDIEMPRMDGYELATHIRNSERLHEIPIIMITSRTGDKHRQRAMDIGVNIYMGKPYTETDLMTNIKEMLALKS